MTLSFRLALGTTLLALTLGGLAACKDDQDAKSDKAGKAEGGGGPAGDDAKVASCNMPSAQSCREYRGGNLALGTEMLAKLCMPEISASAKFSETACPTDKLIATCATNEGKDFYYEGYMIPAADNEQMCKDSGGTFTATK